MTSAIKSVFHIEYFPSIKWYALWLQSEQAMLDQYEYFERKSNRNRCWVSGPNGKIMLTVPLDGGRNQRVKMKDLKIANHEKWSQVHWRTLDACYRRSPFFEYFEHELNAIFLKRHTFLIDLNIATLEFYNKVLRIKNGVYLSQSYIEPSDLALEDFRSNVFSKVSIQVYLQPFDLKNGFISDLSMLDMIFCLGNEAIFHLRNAGK